MATMPAEEYTEQTTYAPSPGTSDCLWLPLTASDCLLLPLIASHIRYTPSPGTHMSGLAAIEKIKCRYIVNAAGTAADGL